MMPLPFAPIGEMHIIRKIGGSPEVKKHLETLGLVAGAAVMLVANLGGNVIVIAKQARVAIGCEMAQKILL